MAEWQKMSCKIGNTQSHSTFFHHSVVLSLPAILLCKLPIIFKRLTAHLLERSVSLLLSLLFCLYNFVYLISEGLLPRPNYVSTILKNVGSLYHGCMFQPNSVSDSDLDNNTLSFLHFEKERRPSKGTVLWAIILEKSISNYKQLLDEVFVISRIIKVEVGVISQSRRLGW